MNPVNKYFEQHILSADPVDLIRMLYQKAIALVDDARRHLALGDVVSRSQAIHRVYEILLELITSLRDEVAPELCANLRRLYLYMQQRLLDANLQQQDGPLAEVSGLLKTLAEAWAPAPVQKSADHGSVYSVPVSGPALHAVSQAYAA